jgi:menaquinone-dependent protoporphyrinogen oxidase
MKILIAYRTQYGAVRRCAELLRDGLPADVALLDLKDQKKARVDGYDVVLIGGSIYGGLIQREVVSFCSRNREALLSKEVGLFICCLYQDEKAEEQLRSSFPSWLLDHAFARFPLGGMLELESLKPMDRFLVERLGEFRENRDLLRYDKVEEMRRAVRRIVAEPGIHEEKEDS